MYVFRADVGKAFALSNAETKCVRTATPRYFVINAHISCGTCERDNLYAEGGEESKCTCIFLEDRGSRAIDK